MEKEYFWIWLSSCEKIQRRKIYEFWKRKQEIKKEDIVHLDQLLGVKASVIEEMKRPDYQEDVKRKIEWMKKNHIFCLLFDDEHYPTLLKQIYDPPVVLYGKGNKENLKSFFLAMIGCREYSQYGKRVAYDMAKELAMQKVGIVSGLARGIDTFSHIGCLSGKGKTIAVLGNGLDSVYPKENKKLAEVIVQQGGTLLSEYMVGTKPNKMHFPARNRLISGISQGILVVEARRKSGTMITVDYAIEQGKTVFAVPGNIGQSNAEGTNQLIQEGAKMVTKIRDILEEY